MTPGRFEKAACLVLALALLVIAGAAGCRAVADDTWPFFHDAWRDVGIAQALLDGTYPEDPVMAGAVSWYNPGVGAIVAAGAAITGAPAALVDSRIGALANLLLPVALFAMVWLFFGPWTAAAALVFFMMGNTLIDRTDIWVDTNTYCPWIWAPSFSQAFFCGALFTYAVARRTGRLSWHLWTGVLWGIVFMIHTAPAVLLGVIQLVLLVPQALAQEDGTRRRALTKGAAQFGLAALIAFVVSLPYSLPILVRYCFVMQNLRPARYIHPSVSLEQLPPLLRSCLTLSNAIAVAGLVIVLKTQRKKPGGQAILAWIFSIFLFLGLNYANQLLAAAEWPQIPQVVPAHHGLIALGGLKAVLFGVGAIGMGRLLAEGVRRGLKLSRATGWGYQAVSLTIIAVSIAILRPNYAEALRFEATMDFGWHTAAYEDREHLRDWMLAQCPPDTVFLSDEQMAVRLVMPMARKAVQVIDIFSNPYEPFEPRANARASMFDALRKADEAAFRALAAEYDVSYLLVREKEVIPDGPGFGNLPMEIVEARLLPFLELVYHADHLAVYRVVPPVEETPPAVAHSLAGE